MTTNFATRYKKDLSIDALKTKLVLQQIAVQKKNRHKEFNKGRKFGLVDVNIQPSNLGGKSKEDVPKAAKIREQERIDMLHRYKAEKELRKLKEQREKPIFKCGKFKPDLPIFLSTTSQIPALNKSKEKEAPIVMRVTRSKTKLPEPKKPQLSSVASSYTSKARSRQIAQQEKKQIYKDKTSKEENKEMQSAISRITHGRTTRATVAAKSRISQASQPTIISGNLPEKKATGKQQKEIIKERSTVVHNTNQHENKELKLHPAKSSEHKDMLAPKRNRSFAPQNFVFKPPKGLFTYEVKPTTPSKANVFLSLYLSWSPSETTNHPSISVHPSSADNEEERVPTEIRDNIAFEGESSVQQPDLLAAEISESTTKHDVSYFRNILQSEKERLTSFCLEWDKTVEMDIPEEAKGLVRITIGQTRLLMAERFKQFEGLIDNCEFRHGEKGTTCTDLHGFWDMVNFQVEDINKKIENLKKLEGNGWQPVDDAQPHRSAKKKPILRRTSKAAGGSAKRSAARKRLASGKAAMKNKTKEGLAAEASGQEAERIFDEGFFQIESPAKSFPGLSCNDGIFDLQPNLDVSLFTLLRNKAENRVSADSCSNLIVFSPFPDNEK